MSKNLYQSLEANDITRERYQDYILRITELGFTARQANDILLKRDSLTTCALLFKNHIELKKYFSIEEIALMASRNCAHRNLTAVIENRQALEDAEFTRMQIIAMATFDSGANNIMAVVQLQSMLKLLGYSVFQIYDMAACRGGDKNLRFVMHYAPDALYLCTPLPIIRNSSEQKAFVEFLANEKPKINLLGRIESYNAESFESKENPAPKRQMLKNKFGFFNKRPEEISDEELHLMGLMGIETDEIIAANAPKEHP